MHTETTATTRSPTKGREWRVVALAGQEQKRFLREARLEIVHIKLGDGWTQADREGAERALEAIDNKEDTRRSKRLLTGVRQRLKDVNSHAALELERRLRDDTTRRPTLEKLCAKVEEERVQILEGVDALVDDRNDGAGAQVLVLWNASEGPTWVSKESLAQVAPLQWEAFCAEEEWRESQGAKEGRSDEAPRAR